MKSSFINSSAVVMLLVLLGGCEAYSQRHLVPNMWFDNVSQTKPVSFPAQWFEDGVCEPTGVSIDSLIKWHQWRMVQLMKGRKGQGGLSYIGTQNEPNLPWQFSDGTFADDYYRNHKWAKISEYWNNLPQSTRDSLTKITIQQEREWNIINRRNSQSPYNIPDSLKPKKKDRKVEVWIPDDTNRTFHNIKPVHYNAAPEIDTNVLKTDALLRMFPDTLAIRQRAVDEYKIKNEVPVIWSVIIGLCMVTLLTLFGAYAQRRSDKLLRTRSDKEMG